MSMMFWRMTGLSTASPVESILDKEDCTLEELLDEDEIIQECKALNSRLINFLRERSQVEQLIRYVVEEPPKNSEKKYNFKFPFVACEIFTCEVDIILNTLVEDEELMDLLFSFLKPDHYHGTMRAGYFSKVVVCLLVRKRVVLMNYIQAHQEILHRLVDLIGITSIMEVLIRLIGADDHAYSNYLDAMPWLEDIHVLEMIVDKLSLSDSPEVHANSAETLCAITRSAPSGLMAKISSPSFVGRLFRHALEDARPKSVLVHSLTVCISLLDPKRLIPASYHPFRGQLTFGSLISTNPETVDGMLESIGDLMKLLDNSSSEGILPTAYGRLQPPLGKHRLKIVEFISVLLTVGNETAEKELIRLGALQRILDLFFEYPFNNFLHHHVESIIMSCLESKRSFLVEHLLQDCNIISKFLEAERNFSLPMDPDKPTVPAEGRASPRIGNIGHITRIANKLIQLGTDNSMIQTHLQGSSGWIDWQTDVLAERNATENVFHWTCGRPRALQDDDEDSRDTDYDVATLANNLSRAFRYGIYSNDVSEEVRDSLERDDEDYFDDDSAEVVISSLRLGDDQESSSFFSNANSFMFEDERSVNGLSTGSLASPSPNSDEHDHITSGENDEQFGTATSSPIAQPPSEPAADSENVEVGTLVNGPIDNSEQSSSGLDTVDEFDKPPEWVEWRELDDLPGPEPASAVLNGEHEGDEDLVVEEAASDISKCAPSQDGNIGELPSSTEQSAGGPQQPSNENSTIDPSELDNTNNQLPGQASGTEVAAAVPDKDVLQDPELKILACPTGEIDEHEGGK